MPPATIHAGNRKNSWIAIAILASILLAIAAYAFIPRTISGQCFIAIRSGENIKFGNVSIGVLSKEQLTNFIKTNEGNLKHIDPDRSTKYDSHLGGGERTPSDGMEKEKFFHSLAKLFEKTKTDADGKFKVEVKNGDFICSFASRNHPGSSWLLEHFAWIVRVDKNTSKNINLSNDNMLFFFFFLGIDTIDDKQLESLLSPIMEKSP